MVQCVCWGLVAERARAKRCSRSWGWIRQRDEAAQDVHPAGDGSLAVTLDSTSTELGEMRKPIRPVLAVKGVAFEGTESLLRIPGGLGRGQIELCNRDIPP